MKEMEDKFLITDFSKKHPWEKEFIIYQWYAEKSSDSSTKYKILFNLHKLTSIFVKIRKYNMKQGSCEKEVTYLDENTFPWKELSQYPFVMKHRSIQDNVFIDHFLRSNQICKYLVEIEYSTEAEQESLPQWEEFILEKKVTDDPRYLNQNMTVPFEKQDQEFLTMLLQIFCPNYSAS